MGKWLHINLLTNIHAEISFGMRQKKEVNCERKTNDNDDTKIEKKEKERSKRQNATK